MTDVKLLKMLSGPAVLCLGLGALAGGLLNLFDASGAVGGLVFILLVSFGGVLGSVVADRMPESRAPQR